MEFVKFVWDANQKQSTWWNYNPAETPWNTISISVGIGEEWENLISRLHIEGLRVDAITIDVALSYTDSIIPIISKVKEKYPDAFLIVGNGCTGEWITFLERLGVDCAKVGVGVSTSCFVGTTVVKTKDGEKYIKDIKVGDEVLTHMGKYHRVYDTLTKYDNDLIDISGNICTRNHKFYVIRKEDKDKITDLNITKYAFWLEADKINNDVLLIELE